MMRLRRIVHRRRSSNGNSSVVTLTVPRDDLHLLVSDAGVAPQKTGVLLKYTNVLKRWKQRVFVLENGLLLYGAPAGSDLEDPDSEGSVGDNPSDVPNKKKKRKKARFLRRANSKDEKERDIKGSINLQFAVISADDADPTRFAIDVGNDVFHIKAETEAERDEWVSALNASNVYFRGLITKAISRAQEVAPASPSKGKGPAVPSLDATSAVLASPEVKRSGTDCTDSDDSVLEDDGLMEAEQSRRALSSELRRILGIWREKWVDDGTVPDREKDFMTTLHETFNDSTATPPAHSEQSIRETAKGLIDLVAWCLHVMETNDEMFERRLKADLTRMMAGDGLPVFPASPSRPGSVNAGVPIDDDFDDDSDTEFFDALSRAASSRSTLARMFSLDQVEQAARKVTIDAPTDNCIDDSVSKFNQVKRVNTTVISRGFKTKREALPRLAKSREKLNIFSILKDAVGKDLSKISMPITLNEPISFLQRLAEDIEYSELLDIGAAEPDPNRRMMYVAATVISHYSSTQGRLGKPFNPLLGETACVIMPNKGNGLRFMAEQVSHHPPISACYAEGSGASWKYRNHVEIKNKFWGKSLEIFPTGLHHIEFPEFGDHYVFEQVTSCVHNIVVGRLWLDNYGEMEIVNRTNGGRCVINFSKTGWMSDSKSFGAIKGTVYDKNGIEKLKLGGNWTRNVYEDLGKGKKNILWTVAERPDDVASQSYNMTKWAISLNTEVTADEVDFVAPTDSRFRPDQRALENGDYPRGNMYKAALEEGQRKRKREMEEAGEVWEPRWFKKISDPVTGGIDYEYGGEFFEKQAVGDWSRCPDIFSCATGQQARQSSLGNR